MGVSSLRWLPVSLGLCLYLLACNGAAGRKEEFVARGKQYLSEHNWQNARLELRNALRIDPKDVELQYLAGVAAERSGNYREAASLYGAVLQRDKDNRSARAALGRLYVVSGASAEAITLAEAGLAASPSDPDLLAIRGSGRLQRGDAEGALADAQRAVATAPTNEHAAALLGTLYSRGGRPLDALVVVDKSVKATPDSVDLRLLYFQLLANVDRNDDAAAQLIAVTRLEPTEPKHRFRLAQFYVLQRNIDAAERVLREAITAAPDDVNAKLALANLIATQRSFGKGEKSLKDLVAADPHNLPLRMALGRFYEVNGRPPLAVDVYRAIAADDRKSAQGLAATNRLAALELAANRTEAASSLITEILTINPRDNDALIGRANIALARGEAAKAIADLRAVLRDQPDAPAVMRTLAQAYADNKDVALAEETLRASMRANPDEVQTRLALAQLLMKAGRASEAQSVVDQLVTDQPGEIAAVEAAMRVQVGRRDLVGARRSAENIKKIRPDLPLGYYLAGLVDEAEGKTVAARDAYEHALSIAPESMEPLAAAARADLALGQAERALARINAVIARAPRNAVVHALKGEVLTQLKRPDDAVAALNDSITLAPIWWVSYRDLALAEISAGRSELAVAAYRRGLQATQGSPNLLTELAALYEKLGRPEEAIAQYEAWLQRDALSEVASNNLAVLLITYKAKDAASVQRAFVLAQRLKDSNEPSYLDTYAWVRYVRGEYADAVTTLQRAVDLAPGVAIFRAHLGLAQYRAGKSVAAKRNLEEALGGAADFAEAAEARAALAVLRKG